MLPLDDHINVLLITQNVKLLSSSVYIRKNDRRSKRKIFTPNVLFILFGSESFENNIDICRYNKTVYYSYEKLLKVFHNNETS